MAEETTAISGETDQGYLLDDAAHQTSGWFSGLDENTKTRLPASGRRSRHDR